MIRCSATGGGGGVIILVVTCIVWCALCRPHFLTDFCQHFMKVYHGGWTYKNFVFYGMTSVLGLYCMEENSQWWGGWGGCVIWAFYNNQKSVKGNLKAGVTLSRNWHKMAIRIWNFQFRAKLAPNLVNSQSTAEASTMPTEGHTMAPEPHTMATRRCEFLLRSLPEGHTKATRWLHDVVLRVRCVRTRSRRRRVTSRWYKTFGRPYALEIQLLIGY